MDELLFGSFANAFDHVIGASLPDELWERLETETFGAVVSELGVYMGVLPAG